MISPCYLTELNPGRPFIKSPVVLAAQEGHLDVLSRLVRDLGFHVDDAEEFTGLNALAAAVEAGHQVKIYDTRLGTSPCLMNVFFYVPKAKSLLLYCACRNI